MLEIESLAVSYRGVPALHQVSLQVKSGEVVSLIGANGAGKTTTLRAVSGVVNADAGAIRFDGRALTGLRPEERVGLGIAHVPEGRRVFPQLSVRDNLIAGAHRIRDRSRIHTVMEQVFALFPRLGERRSQWAETLSGGEQQMLALGRALMSGPRLLMLDEPSLGLAPLVVEEVARAVLRLRGAGLTVLLVEQNARLALAMCDRAYVLENGRTTLSGRGEVLQRDPDIVASYLGGRAASGPGPADRI